MPEIHRDEYGIQYVTTKGGNQVAVAEDPQGRTFFIDKAGNLYYDTGDADIGAYLVSPTPPCRLRRSKQCYEILQSALAGYNCQSAITCSNCTIKSCMLIRQAA